MSRKQTVSVEPEGPAEVKTRIPVWLYPSTLEVIGRAADTANCKSRSEYLEKAALFYAGYIFGQEATAYLPPALVSVLRSTVQDTENRICQLLFKLAVELDIAQCHTGRRGPLPKRRELMPATQILRRLNKEKELAKICLF